MRWAEVDRPGKKRQETRGGGGGVVTLYIAGCVEFLLQYMQSVDGQPTAKEIRHLKGGEGG